MGQRGPNSDRRAGSGPSGAGTESSSARRTLTRSRPDRAGWPAQHPPPAVHRQGSRSNHTSSVDRLIIRPSRLLRAPRRPGSESHSAGEAAPSMPRILVASQERKKVPALPRRQRRPNHQDDADASVAPALFLCSRDAARNTWHRRRGAGRTGSEHGLRGARRDRQPDHESSTNNTWCSSATPGGVAPAADLGWPSSCCPGQLRVSVRLADDDDVRAPDGPDPARRIRIGTPKGPASSSKMWPADSITVLNLAGGCDAEWGSTWGANSEERDGSATYARRTVHQATDDVANERRRFGYSISVH